MKAIIKVLLFLPAFFSNALLFAQEITLKEKGSVDVYYTYGDVAALRFSNIPKEREFKMNFGDPNHIHYGLPDKNALANVSGIAIRFRAWTVLGELVTHPTVVWAINKQFLKGEKHLVQYTKISKYPDLAKRYYNIKPYYMRAIVGMGLNPKNIYDGGAYAWFKITDNDVLLSNSAAHPATFPTAPLNTGEGMIISTDDQRKTFVTNFSSFVAINNQKEVAKKLMEATTVADFAWIKLSEGNARKNGTANNQNIYLELKWPLKAIDEIQELYEKYEKGEASPLEKLNEQLAKENHKSYSGNDDWAKPFEDDVKGVTMESSHGTKEFVLRKPNGKLVKGFPYSKFNSGTALAGTKYFVVGTYDTGTRTQIYRLVNAKGNFITVDGKDSFVDISANGSQLTFMTFSEVDLYTDVLALYVNQFGLKSNARDLVRYDTFETAKNEMRKFFQRKKEAWRNYTGPNTYSREYSVSKVKLVNTSSDLTVKSSKIAYVFDLK